MLFRRTSLLLDASRHLHAQFVLESPLFSHSRFLQAWRQLVNDVLHGPVMTTVLQRVALLDDDPARGAGVLLRVLDQAAPTEHVHPVTAVTSMRCPLHRWQVTWAFMSEFTLSGQHLRLLL